MTTLKIFEERLVRVPYSHFWGAQDMEERKKLILAYGRHLSDMFGSNWNPIGPMFKENRIDECVELTYQRIYEIPG